MGAKINQRTISLAGGETVTLLRDLGTQSWWHTFYQGPMGTVVYFRLASSGWNALFRYEDERDLRAVNESPHATLASLVNYVAESFLGPILLSQCPLYDPTVARIPKKNRPRKKVKPTLRPNAEWNF